MGRCLVHHGFMADIARRDGHGWAIAAAFVAQAGIFVGIGVLLGGASSSATASDSGQAFAVPAPAVVSPMMPLMSPQGAQQPGALPYTVFMDGQSASGVFVDEQPAPAFMVAPGQDLTATLSVTVPASLNITDLSVSLEPFGQTGQDPQVQDVYDNPAQPLSPGMYTFTLNWAGSASELQPGTTWSLFMSTSAPDGTAEGEPIATVSVGS
jgi:hypothetical protein